MNQIIVIKRGTDYQAQVVGKQGLWGCGSSIDTAIGNLVRISPEEFSVKIQLPPGEDYCKHCGGTGMGDSPEGTCVVCWGRGEPNPREGHQHA